MTNNIKNNLINSKFDERSLDATLFLFTNPFIFIETLIIFLVSYPKN